MTQGTVTSTGIGFPNYPVRPRRLQASGAGGSNPPRLKDLRDDVFAPSLNTGVREAVNGDI
jgi:hypothetical protein